jgi:hypothetical protein
MKDKLLHAVALVATVAMMLVILVFDARAASFVEGGGPHPSPLMPDIEAYDAFYSSFVDPSCCRTSQCCWEISDDEVVDLGDNKFRIVASGQVVERKGYSPDGKYHRCACDYVAGAPGYANWKIWPGAHTRCLFTPSFGS